MSIVPADLLKSYVQSQQFTSTAEIMVAINDMFRDVIQQVMEVELGEELGEELGYEKSERMSTPGDDKILRLQ